MASSANRALIVGAGIGGLTAAAALGRRGWKVDVVEIKPTYAVVGIGIGLRANSLRLLKQLGVTEQLISIGYSRGTWNIFDRHGNFLYAVEFGFADDGLPHSLGLGRAELAQVLTSVAQEAGATIRLNTTVTSFEQDGLVGVELSDGTSGEYDLVVGCDGINSSTRRLTFGDDAVPRYTGFAAVRMSAPQHPSIKENSYWQGFGRIAGAALLGSGGIYVHVTSPQPGRPHYDRVGLHDMFREQLDRGGFTSPIVDVAASVTEPEGISYTPLEEILLPKPWHQGRVVIIGDAAHSSTPQLGQGASMAIEDALVLAEMLGDAGKLDDLDTILSRFYDRRIPRIRMVHEVSHRILASQMNTETPTNYESWVSSMATQLEEWYSDVRRELETSP